MAAVETPGNGPPFTGWPTLLSPAAFGNFPTVIDRLAASPNPDTCTAQTIARMSQVIHSSLSSPVVRSAVRSATRHLAQASPQQKAEAIFWWVKTHIEFEQDETILRARLGIYTPEELLITPARLLTMDRPSGDCDDFVMLTCAMLLVAGVACDVVTVPNPAEDPWYWGHIFTEAVYADGSSQALDTSHGQYPGQEVSQNPTRRKAWPLFASTGLHGFQGLGQTDPSTDASTTDLSTLFASIDPFAGLNESDTAGVWTIAGGATPIVSSSGAINWNAIIPGLFSAAEKIGIQQTVPAGQIQVTGPGGTSTVEQLPAGVTTGFSIPGITGTLDSSSLIWLLLLGGGAVILFSALGHK